jgi:ATP-binding cassette subfamily F protein 3
MSSFSGGWRMRVALAAVLFSAPDLLLLDEPTNHLDLEATLWLEQYLAKFPGAVLLVSHDRQLLDRAVEAIAHLDGGKLTLTPGGFAEFIRIKTEKALQQGRAAEKAAEQRAHMQSFVDRFRAKASKARQAQSRLKALERMPQIESVVEDRVTKFNFPEPNKLAPPMLSLDGVDVGYDGRTVLGGISLRIDMEDRIALLGTNGNGKSTLAKLLAGRLDPMRGRQFRTGNLRVGYFAQHQEEDLVASETPYEHLSRALPKATPPQVRAQAARFGLDADRVNTKVSAMSGGSRDHNSRKSNKQEKAEARSRTAPLRQAVKDAELRLAKLNAERGLLEKKLADPGMYSPGKAKDLAYINQRIAAIKRETATAETEWLAAEAALEEAVG